MHEPDDDAAGSGGDWDLSPSPSLSSLSSFSPEEFTFSIQQYSSEPEPTPQPQQQQQQQKQHSEPHPHHRHHNPDPNHDGSQQRQQHQPYPRPTSIHPHLQTPTPPPRHGRNGRPPLESNTARSAPSSSFIRSGSSLGLGLHLRGVGMGTGVGVGSALPLAPVPVPLLGRARGGAGIGPAGGGVDRPGGLSGKSGHRSDSSRGSSQRVRFEDEVEEAGRIEVEEEGEEEGERGRDRERREKWEQDGEHEEHEELEGGGEAEGRDEEEGGHEKKQNEEGELGGEVEETEEVFEFRHGQDDEQETPVESIDGVHEKQHWELEHWDWSGVERDEHGDADFGYDGGSEGREGEYHGHDEDDTHHDYHENNRDTQGLMRKQQEELGEEDEHQDAEEVDGLPQDGRLELMERLCNLAQTLSSARVGGGMEAEVLDVLHAKVDEMEGLLAMAEDAADAEDTALAELEASQLEESPGKEEVRVEIEEQSQTQRVESEPEPGRETRQSGFPFEPVHRLSPSLVREDVLDLASPAPWLASTFRFDELSLSPAHSHPELTEATNEALEAAKQAALAQAAIAERVAAEAEKLNVELAKIVQKLHQRKEESDHLHALLVERAEAAASRILDLEKEVSDLEDDILSNESELRHLRLKIRAVETLCHELIPADSTDPELFQSIENWKADWVLVRDRMIERKKGRKERRLRLQRNGCVFNSSEDDAGGDGESTLTSLGGLSMSVSLLGLGSSPNKGLGGSPRKGLSLSTNSPRKGYLLSR